MDLKFQKPILNLQNRQNHLKVNKIVKNMIEEKEDWTNLYMKSNSENVQIKLSRCIICTIPIQYTQKIFFDFRDLFFTGYSTLAKINGKNAGPLSSDNHICFSDEIYCNCCFEKLNKNEKEEIESRKYFEEMRLEEIENEYFNI